MSGMDRPGSQPQLWMIVGGNGVGKSTFHRHFLKPFGLPLINADDIARDIWPEAPEYHSYEAARLAEDMRHRYLRANSSFCFETVFSHPSKIDFMAEAKAQGYQVILVYVHLQGDALNCARVATRRALGGHDVPEQKIRSRIPRTIANVKAALPLCDVVKMYDNSDNACPYVPVLELHAGVVVQRDPGYAWAELFTPSSAVPAPRHP